MLLLCFISRGLEILSVNYTSTNEKSEARVFKNIKFVGNIFNN